MGVKRLEDLDAFQLAVEFKLNVYELFRRSPSANQDFKYRDQLFEAAAGVEMNLAEGWGRLSTAEMRVFFRYARASIYEAKRHVLDGVSRGHFTPADCEKALVLADRTAGAITNLWKSLEQFTGRNTKRRKEP